MTQAELQCEALNVLRVMIVALVDYPNHAEVTAVPSSGCTTLNVTTHPDDIGKVIGKQGRIARSLRIILGGMSKRYGHTFALNIVEPRGGFTP